MLNIIEYIIGELLLKKPSRAKHNCTAKNVLNIGTDIPDTFFVVRIANNCGNSEKPFAMPAAQMILDHPIFLANSSLVIL